MKDQEADEALFAGMAAAACADVNPEHLIQCQKKILSERMEMTQMDCHHELAHAVHERNARHRSTTTPRGDGTAST